MDFKGKRILVCDGFAGQIPGVLRQLHELECVATTLCSSRLDPGFTSRYPVERIVVKGYKENLTIREKAISQWIYSGQFDVVLPVSDQTTDIVTRGSEKYSRVVRIAAAPFEAFSKAYDKSQTFLGCEHANVPCPKTYHQGDDLDSFLDQVQFPLAVKPRNGHGAIGFRRVDTRDEIITLIDEGLLVPEDNVIQEFIPQDDVQYLCYLFIDHDRQVKTALTVEKQRWFPVNGGALCFGRVTDRPDIIQMSSKLLWELNWLGFGEVCYINDPRDNTPKVIEINGRIPASVRICFLNGFNVVRQLLELAYGEDVTRYITTQKPGMGIRCFQTDFLWLLQSSSKHKLRKWLDCRNVKDLMFDIRDPLPFFSYSIKNTINYRKEMSHR